jgi:hypothetical protein
MPRKSRIDAPGALQHVIARGINHKWLFRKLDTPNSNPEKVGIKHAAMAKKIWSRV